MNWLDFFILAVMAWFTIAAYLSGFIRETVGLASVVVGVVIAGFLHEDLAANLAIVVDQPPWTDIAAFLAIVGIVALVGLVISLFLRTTAELLFLGWADRTAGAVFGFLKAIVLVQALTVIFVLRPALGLETVIADSAIGSFFLQTAPVVRALLPAEFDQAIRDFAT